MARVIVIGATGHVGTYLVPRLVEAGHDVVAISRGKAEPYGPHATWQSVERQQMDRAQMEEEGSFGPAVRALRPDIVIDMICFTLESARHLAGVLDGHVGHFLHTGTIWTHGHSISVPTREDAPKTPFGDYGEQKKAIEDYLLGEARRRAFPATLIHPGHIVGPGWPPLNPAGHFNISVFSTIARGETVRLPNLGLETVHHVHADDVAGMFMAAISNWRASTGESFHAVSDQAVTLRGYAEAMFRWFGHEPKLEFFPYDEWSKMESAEDARATWEHIARSPNCSMDKARRLLEFTPRRSSLQAVQESVRWLIAQGRIGA
ncbi:NAD-dependent epimerase/dehydratase family protein [Rhizobium mongolense]|uniref:Nucleoside-diphosphate-sugar epimerase n=2 Tax=Rhizobium mongolense TaxID=57676 RepID=A0ABR6ITS7_9HYPH|nr:NAD-dependent epimerase/dehydratase family protein [Rhizobium mongolense]MBB4231315.1 nucleoside-diphosphate-sugar epimerase [Rhizobium mongolense]TVZ66389.1 nucleoside-diphosphate-sugar epimerase [Rhizobium mongolense USDA 1844]